MHLDANNLLSFAATLERRELVTLKRKMAFEVKVTPDGLEIIPGSTGKCRRVSSGRIQRVCDEFGHSKSIKPGDYRTATRDASYLIALIDAYLHKHN
jgi:hypothetical protein